MHNVPRCVLPAGTYFNIYVMNNISLASVLPYTMYNWPDFRNHPYIKCRLYIIGQYLLPLHFYCQAHTHGIWEQTMHRLLHMVTMRDQV
jgi:hypothetical protein